MGRACSPGETKVICACVGEGVALEGGGNALGLGHSYSEDKEQEDGVLPSPGLCLERVALGS